MGRAWTAKETRTLRRMYGRVDVAVIAGQLDRTVKAVRSRAKVLQLGRSRAWCVEHIEAVRKRYPHEQTSAIAKDIGRPVGQVYQKAAKLGLKKSAAYREAERRRQAERLTRTGKQRRFTKGHTPWNKGGSYTAGGRSAETRFKPGQKPQTWVPIGTEVRCSGGYLKRKIRDDAPPGQSRFNWRYVHLMLWEEHHGPVPDGHAVAFVNGDKTDIRVENLELVSRQELMRRNTLHRYRKEVTLAIQAKGALQRQINKRTDRGKEQG